MSFAKAFSGVFSLTKLFKCLVWVFTIIKGKRKPEKQILVVSDRAVKQKDETRMKKHFVNDYQ